MLGARCGSSARRDLWRGWQATASPTLPVQYVKHNELYAAAGRNEKRHEKNEGNIRLRRRYDDTKIYLHGYQFSKIELQHEQINQSECAKKASIKNYESICYSCIEILENLL